MRYLLRYLGPPTAVAGRRAREGKKERTSHPIGLQLEAMTKHCGLGRDNHDDDGDEDDVDISSRRQ